MFMRLEVSLAWLASEFGVSTASALDTIATITRIAQLRFLAFGERLDDDELDILLEPSHVLRSEYHDTTSVALRHKPTMATMQRQTFSS